MSAMAKVMVALAMGLALASAIRYNTHASRQEGKLNVHIVAHTHDDVGWLKTVDQYYMGANNSIQHAAVQYILDSVVTALQQNPDRTFIYVEQAFFQRWYREQTDVTQAIVKKLVDAGQLEFINGGWCMHDEAAPHYVDMIDQTTLGHRFIKEEFGKMPTVGWQIDPFGHSATQASLLSAEAGFNALFFGRIDYADHDKRVRDKALEFIWRASPSLGSSAEVFSGAFLSGNYGPPDGFCFDQFCDDAQPIQDDPRLHDVNVKNRVDLFVQRAMEYLAVNLGNDIMFEMGSDFQYENANQWFKNMDKLIHYVNLDGRVNAFYSTPSRYAAAKSASNVTFPVKEDDFFPYADGEHAYWTGYFTSRPALKRNVRATSAYLQTARQIEVLSHGDGTATSKLSESMGVAQHHDAVSGTSKQHVAYDYALRLSEGVAEAQPMVAAGLAALAAKTPSSSLSLQECPLLNVSICPTSQDKATSFAVLLYNPLLRDRLEVVSFPLSSASAGITVLNPAGVPEPTAQVVVDGDLRSVVFTAKVPALGFSTYFVQPSAALSSEEQGKTVDATVFSAVDAGADVTIENERLVLTFSGATGKLVSLTNKVTGASTALNQHFEWYASYVRDNDQNSGAYIFRPNSTESYPVSDAVPTLEVSRGATVQVVKQNIAPWVTQYIRLYAGAEYAEFEYSVGPIPIEDGVGKEVITRYDTNLASNGEWYTDSNGREMMLRRLNYRPTWDLTVTEPIAGNYYPINAAMFLHDGAHQLTVLTDRSQGGGSLKDGSLEVMVHRRTLADDSRGVGEPINETDGITPYPDAQRIGQGLVILGKHYLTFEPVATAASIWRPLASRIYMPLFPTFSPILPGGVNAFLTAFNSEVSMAATTLPENVDLITVQAWDSNHVLLRLAHQFATNEDASLSKPVVVSLTSLLKNELIASVEELSLTANQPKAAMQRLKFNSEGVSNDVPRNTEAPVGETLDVTLGAMEIRTFMLTLAR